MLSRAATRTSTSLVTRRAFHATRPRMSSPYHYAEGPYTNIPFNPHKRGFGLLFWGFLGTGFFAPFGIAGTSSPRGRELMERLFRSYQRIHANHTSTLVWQTYKPQ